MLRQRRRYRTVDGRIEVTDYGDTISADGVRGRNMRSYKNVWGDRARGYATTETAAGRVENY